MVGPNYHRASAPVPKQYKEQPPEGWTEAAPSDAAPKGDWWTDFHDPLLDELEPQVAVSNQTVRQDYANYLQAVAEVKVARAQLFPALGAHGLGHPSGRPRLHGHRRHRRPVRPVDRYDRHWYDRHWHDRRAASILGASSDHLRHARRHGQLDARPLGTGAPPDRGKYRHRAVRRGDSRQCHAVRADLARDDDHRAARGRRQHRSRAKDGQGLRRRAARHEGAGRRRHHGDAALGRDHGAGRARDRRRPI